MVLTEKSYDRDFDAYHLTLMGVDSDDRGYLTVSRLSSEIVGTFTVGGNEYRIISLNGQSQLVYPVEPQFKGFRRASLPDMSSPLGRLEARHLQLGYLASIGSRNVITARDGGLIRTLGVEVGEIDIARARRSDVSAEREQFDEEVLATELEEFFNDHRVMTLYDENVELDVSHIRTFTGGLDVHARQIINGIPVEVPLMLAISNEGKVQDITGRLLKTSTATVNRGTWLSFEEALPLATSKATADFGSTGTATPYSPELLYMGESSDDTLIPYCRFNLNFDPLAAAPSLSVTAFEARVNALTGEAFVRPSAMEGSRSNPLH